MVGNIEQCWSLSTEKWIFGLLAPYCCQCFDDGISSCLFHVPKHWKCTDCKGLPNWWQFLGEFQFPVMLGSKEELLQFVVACKYVELVTILNYQFLVTRNEIFISKDQIVLNQLLNTISPGVADNRHHGLGLQGNIPKCKLKLLCWYLWSPSWYVTEQYPCSSTCFGNMAFMSARVRRLGSISLRGSCCGASGPQNFSGVSRNVWRSSAPESR